MENIIQALMDSYNVRKLDKICNDKACETEPTKKIFVYEYKKFSKKGIVSLYLCEDHVKSVRGFIKTLREANPNMIIEREITELGR
jgi:hypothetical protein